MPEKRRRVRVITDPLKYNRHVRKKWMRRILRVALWVVLLAAGLLLFWLVLGRMLQPPAQE
jgi:hypothetical protein